MRGGKPEHGAVSVPNCGSCPLTPIDVLGICMHKSHWFEKRKEDAKVLAFLPFFYYPKGGNSAHSAACCLDVPHAPHSNKELSLLNVHLGQTQDTDWVGDSSKVDPSSSP